MLVHPKWTMIGRERHDRFFVNYMNHFNFNGADFKKIAAFIFLALTSFLCELAFADIDPPGQVGRLSFVSGTIQVFDKETDSWQITTINRPVTSGDVFYTVPRGFAEIRVGAMSIRLDGDTEVEFTLIDDSHIDVQLDQGQVAFNFRSIDDAQNFRLTTKQGQIFPTKSGSYVVSSTQDSTSVTAWSGNLQFQGSNGVITTVQSVSKLDIGYDGNGNPSFRVSQPLNDSFYQWVSSRVIFDSRANMVDYISPQMTGSEDLQYYGSWDNHPDFGPVWYPSSIPDGWAPYRYGHWTWVEPWGWTWVDDAPWGFAPFHYGRWVYWHEHWGWCPGRYVAHPVYAPALVGWVGASGFSVHVSSAPVGWFPLAPHEVYVPPYRVSQNYVRNVNFTHVTNIANINAIVNTPQSVVQNNRYIYRSHPQAVTVVSGNVLSHQQPVSNSVVPIDEQRLSALPINSSPLNTRHQDGGFHSREDGHVQQSNSNLTFSNHHPVDEGHLQVQPDRSRIDGVPSYPPANNESPNHSNPSHENLDSKRPMSVPPAIAPQVMTPDSNQKLLQIIQKQPTQNSIVSMPVAPSIQAAPQSQYRSPPPATSNNPLNSNQDRHSGQDRSMPSGLPHNDFSRDEHANQHASSQQAIQPAAKPQQQSKPQPRHE